MKIVVHLRHLGEYYSILVDFSIVYIHFLTISAKPSYNISSDNLRPLPDRNNKIRGAFEFEPGCTSKWISQLSPYVVAESSWSVHFGYFSTKLNWKTSSNLFQPQMTTQYTWPDSHQRKNEYPNLLQWYL